jgi:geranylgeranyl reductase family protein
MGQDADVIVCGAGPAGSLAAYTLASQGVNVLILEKSVFPRYKVCGGGLTHKILADIPFDLSPVIETTIRSIHFSYRLAGKFTRDSETSLMYCTMRDNLDEFLLRKATDAGARVSFSSHVREIRQEPLKVIVKTGHNEYSCDLVIGADGASGIARRAVSLKTRFLKGMAWEGEIRTTDQVLKEYAGTVFLDWGTLPGGYGWIFPKKDHISAGVGGPAALSGAMTGYYQQFLKSTGIGFGETISLRSWPIPVNTGKTPVHSGRVMLTGDAAGLTDPLTGEGIHYSVRSGITAASVAMEFLSGRISTLGSYSERINGEILAELNEALSIRDIFNVVPGKIHRLVRDRPRVWRAFGKALRGERKYQDVRNGFGRFRFLWKVACGAARIFYIIKQGIYANRFDHRRGKWTGKSDSR